MESEFDVHHNLASSAAHEPLPPGPPGEEAAQRQVSVFESQLICYFRQIPSRLGFHSPGNNCQVMTLRVMPDTRMKKGGPKPAFSIT